MYHRDNLHLSQMGAFTYVTPSAPGEKGCIIFTDLFLPMGWVESPNFFCTFSETLTDFANTSRSHPMAIYQNYLPPPPRTHTPTPKHTKNILTDINCYMDDIISAVQGGSDRQHQVFDCTVHALKFISLSLSGGSKDSVSLKKSYWGKATVPVSRSSWGVPWTRRRVWSPSRSEKCRNYSPWWT